MNGCNRETAYAKINLALHVRAREPDGYHRIETLFAFAEDGDVLSVEPSDSIGLTVTGRFADALAGERDNLVLRAARSLAEEGGVSAGAALRLEKKLPVASGIGGGSADAAATLRLLYRFWGLSLDAAVLERIARSLGADVPACLTSTAVRGDGRGDELIPVDRRGLDGMPLLLVNPGVALSTEAVFKAWDTVDRGTLIEATPLVAARAGRNDLEKPARTIVPEIGSVIALLERMPGTVLSRMSGSGATCFALFEDEEACAVADAEVARLQPGWWRLKTALLGQ